MSDALDQVVVAERGPHLLAGDPPHAFGVRLRTRSDPADIGPGIRLRNADRRRPLAADEAGDPFLAQVFPGELEQDLRGRASRTTDHADRHARPVEQLAAGRIDE